MDSGLAVIIGTAIGGLIGFSSSLGLYFIQIKRERAALFSAFKEEISAILEIIEKRKYRKHIEALVALADQSIALKNEPIPFIEVNIKENYFHVFETNSGRIGHLPKSIPEKICKFYTIAKSLIEDFTTTKERGCATWLASNQKMLLEEDLGLIKEMESLGKVIVNFKT